MKQTVTHWCGLFMKHGKREGVYQWFYCARCKEWEKRQVENNWAKEALEPSAKQKVLATIMTKKVMKLRTLRRKHAGLCLDKILRELQQEGAIVVQQSGFVADSLHHEKLIAAR